MTTDVISIHAPREGCDRRARIRQDLWFQISIHAPREGCDPHRNDHNHHRPISIHAPREGCDGPKPRWYPSQGRFQSTHPVRGATSGSFSSRPSFSFQSTHPVRGATHRIRVGFLVLGISIHAPREGCDLRVDEGIHPPERFQSTHPVRGATHRHPRDQRQGQISIHPVRGATAGSRRSWNTRINFNPRTP